MREIKLQDKIYPNQDGLTSPEVDRLIGLVVNRHQWEVVAIRAKYEPVVQAVQSYFGTLRIFSPNRLVSHRGSCWYVLL